MCHSNNQICHYLGFSPSHTTHAGYAYKRGKESVGGSKCAWKKKRKSNTYRNIVASCLASIERTLHPVLTTYQPTMSYPHRPTITIQAFKFSIHNEFDGFQGVKYKVLLNQLGLYKLANNHLLTNDRRKLIFFPDCTRPFCQAAQPNQ